MGGRPAWWRCIASCDPRFTKGVAYEVLEYDRSGHAVIVTDFDRDLATLPTELASFVPHDPWEEYRQAQAMSASGQDPKGLEAKPASAVPEGDAPNPSDPPTHSQDNSHG